MGRVVSLIGVYILLYTSIVISAQLTSTTIIVPVNGTIITSINFVDSDDYTVDIYNRNIAEISLNRKTHQVQISGKSSGQTILMLVDEQGSLSAARVIVKEPAGSVPELIKVFVSGNPANQELLEEALQTSLRLSTTIKNNATILVDNFVFNDRLYVGEWGFGRADVSVSGENYFEVTKNIVFLMANKKIDPMEDSYLYISNTPEIIDSSGIICSEKVLNLESMRLVYHHGNIMRGDTKYLSLILKNSLNEPVKLRVTFGLGGASVDSLFVGHSATKRFLEKELYNQSQFLTIPAGKSLKLFDQKMPAGKYVSGLVRLSVLEGASIDASLIAHTEFCDVEGLPTLSPDKVKSHIKGKINDPKVVFKKKFFSTETYRHFEIGLEPELYNEGSQKLVGNYGIYHLYQINLKNDLKINQQFHFSVIPRGGFMRGCFIINNELVETNVLDPYESDEAHIYSIILYPNQEQKIEILTLPQPGSYYPVHLVMRSG